MGLFDFWIGKKDVPERPLREAPMARVKDLSVKELGEVLSKMKRVAAKAKKIEGYDRHLEPPLAFLTSPSPSKEGDNGADGLAVTNLVVDVLPEVIDTPAADVVDTDFGGFEGGDFGGGGSGSDW